MSLFPKVPIKHAVPITGGDNATVKVISLFSIFLMLVLGTKAQLAVP